MRSPLQTVLLATNFASVLVLAVANRLSQTIAFPNNRQTSGAKGAIYFMNNDLKRNYLFAADIEDDATFTLRKAYYTGGKGGTEGTFDALFSQGAVAATKYSSGYLDVVVNVNAGSNTVTVFQINPSNPSDLKILGEPVHSGGDFPVSVAINKAGDMVCALNSGSTGSVSCFQLDIHKGLIPLPNTTRSLGSHLIPNPNGPNMTASSVIFTEDDKRVAAIVKGTAFRDESKDKLGHIAVWDINEDHSLSTNYTRMPGGVSLWSLTQIPGRNAFLSADSITGIEIFDLDTLARNSSARSQTFKTPIHLALCWSDYSAITGNFYIVDSHVPTINEVHFDANLNGTVVAIYELEKYDRSTDLSINHVNGKDRLYLLAPNSTSVEAYTIHGPGNLERIDRINVGALINETGLPFDSHHAYGMASYVV